ALEIIFMFVLS
ncbi:unnamed protein product, partial [Allacma fusca]